jgi:hypothetical protein
MFPVVKDLLVLRKMKNVQSFSPQAPKELELSPSNLGVRDLSPWESQKDRTNIFSICPRRMIEPTRRDLLIKENELASMAYHEI